MVLHVADEAVFRDGTFGRKVQDVKCDDLLHLQAASTVPVEIHMGAPLEEF